MSGLSLSLHAIPDLPLIGPGDDLAEIIYQALEKSGHQLKDDDILIIAQKIVSKAENRIINLNNVTPSDAAIDLAARADKDPRLVELILQESNAVIRCKPGVIIVEHHSGIVLANAGIDHSNVGGTPEIFQVTLLPQDANASAAAIRRKLMQYYNRRIGIIISDSIGRAWRKGTVGIAIGSSGIMALRDLRGNKDLFGETLRVSETADIDALSGAAGLLMGEADDGTPLVLVRGYPLDETNQDANALLRQKDEDLFR